MLTSIVITVMSSLPADNFSDFFNVLKKSACFSHFHFVVNLSFGTEDLIPLFQSVCQRLIENCRNKLPKLKSSSSCHYFFQTKSPKPKKASFTVIDIYIQEAGTRKLKK